MAKKAILAELKITVRVIVDEGIDPNLDPEFDTAVYTQLYSRLTEEKVDYISPLIEDFNDDTENPYDPEYDR